MLQSIGTCVYIFVTVMIAVFDFRDQQCCKSYFFLELVTVTVTSSKKELVTGKSYMSRNVTSYRYKVTLKCL